MAEPANLVTVVDFRVPFWRLVAFAITIGVIVAILRAIGIGVMMWQWQI